MKSVEPSKRKGTRMQDVLNTNKNRFAVLGQRRDATQFASKVPMVTKKQETLPKGRPAKEKSYSFRVSRET
jgi:hypothetical protein